ncbi:ATP-binding protein [Streptomyces sp. NPDC020755]|uniref:sensor histidine kinase n=1 Tax=Streptomyces sp. NPDC020755 TaxID=3154790 RepID=UPI0033C76795
MNTESDNGGSRGLRTAHREREALAAALCLTFALLAFLGWCVLAVAVFPGTAVPDSVARLPDVTTGLTLLLVGLPGTALGFLLVVRGEARAAGWLLMAGGTGSTVPLLTGLLVAVLPARDALLLGALLVQWLGSTVYAYALLSIPLHCPGRPLSPLPRRAVRAYAFALLVACLLIGAVAAGAQEQVQGRANPLHPTAWGHWARAWFTPCMRAAPWLLVAGSAVNVLVLAARRAFPAPRRSRAAVFTAAYVIWLGAEFAMEHDWLTPWASTSTFAALTAAWLTAIGYAASHDGLWRPDRNVRRLLITAVVVTAVTGGLVTASFTVSAVLPGAATPGGLALAALALAIGSGVRPLAGWAARRVDRVFHGVRALPYEAVRTLADRLRLAPDPGGVPEALCRSATDCLRFPGAAVEVETRAGLRRLAATGTGPGPAPHVFALRHLGSVVGAVLVAPRTGEAELHPLDADLLQLLADQAAPAVEALRLLEDVTAARRDLVMAREEERRRLRRDMHDGLGPLLAAVLLQLDTAQAVSGPAAGDPAPLPHARHALEEAIGEVRRLTSGLGPAALDERGLGPALRELAARLGPGAGGPRVAVTVAPEPLPPLPAAVETALHRLAAEALSNAVRHAHATEVALTLAVSPGQALLTVTDDGRGLPGTVRPGALGLSTMTERARELGGDCTVGPPPVGHGTRVRAVVPLTPPPAPPEPATPVASAASATPRTPAASAASAPPRPARTPPCPGPRPEPTVPGPGPRPRPGRAKPGPEQDNGPGRPGHRATDAGAT